MAIFPLILTILSVCFYFNSAFAQETLFRDWQVECSTTGYCEASTPDTKNQFGHLRVARLPEANALWEISVEQTGDSQVALRPTRLRIAGQRAIPLTPSRDFASFGDERRFHLTNSASLQPFFRRMIESRRLFVTFQVGTDAPRDASYSLNGLAAALLHMDERQGQLGSTRIAGPPDGPRQTAGSATKNQGITDARTLINLIEQDHKSQRGCRMSQERPTELFELDEQHFLGMIDCAEHPGHRRSSLYVIEAETHSITPQYWAVFTHMSGWIATSQLDQARFDKAQKTLSMEQTLNLDEACQISGSWQWQSTSNTRPAGFSMRKFVQTPACPGSKHGRRKQLFPLP